MGAPQIIVAILLVIEITRSAVKHGQMKEREHFGKNRQQNLSIQNLTLREHK
jgi:hypothetical protein